ncbi:MAG TPA: carboxypeptidase regulatory-like domain-containing protein [Gemmatimonadaceae bacterium]|nr:carboxypeptidase regulatory-like domain-containing protein [Gemmatimonadaceae bacterium]
MSMRKAVLLAAALLAAAVPAMAQQLRGTVRDSATGAPVIGAVVIGRDAAGGVVSRIVGGADGRYTLPARGVTSVQVLRIGFQPKTMVVATLSAGEVREVSLTLTAIPTFLDKVHVVADARSQCPRRADAIAAANLYNQARAGLLATVVAREASPATVTRLAYDRTLDANGVQAVSQAVRTETADRATVSFNATQTAVDFVSRGFVTDTGAARSYLGPDADVLLDEQFASAYCFRIAEPDRAHPTWIGLGFAPARRRDGRVDIDGTLWIDTVAKRLQSTTFTYLGLDEVSTGFGAGGTVSYREVSPGIVLIDRWQLRLVGGTAGDGAAQAATGRQYEIHEVGGELVNATWPDGRAWAAPLGAIRVNTAASNGRPAPAGTVLGLANTDYRAEVDAAGAAAFTQLAPGPYTVMVVDRQLADLGLTIPADLAFTARRDSTITAVAHVPTAAEFVASLCGGAGRVATDAAWLVGRIGAGDGRAVPAARWRLARSGDGGWVAVADGGATGTSGLFTHCRNLAIGQTVQLQAWRQGEAPMVVTKKITDKITVLPVVLPSAIVVRGGGAAALTGTVLDSADHATVAGAYLEVMGTRLTAISDSAGRFIIADVPRGEYTVEVRTPTLDALGAVGRTTVDHDGRTPARIYLPTMNQLLSAMCGPDTNGGAGVVIGNVQLTGEMPPPDGVRLVAEWTDHAAPAAPGSAPVGRTRWLRTRADANGTYRLCGVPVNTALIVRTQVDSGVDAAARPLDVTVDPVRRFARLDVTMEPGLNLGAAFAGTVVSDSTDEPIPGAEVALADIGVTATTNRDGAFRIDSIPPGTHRVTVRRPGYAPLTAQVGFAQNQTIDHRIVLGHATVALATVEVTEAPSVNREFDANRKLGIGKFLTRDDLEKNAGRKLSDIMQTVPGFGSIGYQGSSSHGWVVGKRAPAHLAPRNAMNGECGSSSPAQSAKPGGAPLCAMTPDNLKDQGIYCPATSAEQLEGVTCACYAQVWVDGHLMNHERPTEPFDINVYSTEQLEGIEWYSGPAQTPAQYSSLNSPCGVLALWTRRSQEFHDSHSVIQER